MVLKIISFDFMWKKFIKNIKKTTFSSSDSKPSSPIIDSKNPKKKRYFLKEKLSI